MQIGFGLDVDAHGRLVDDQQFHACCDPFRDRNLLLIAARQIADGLIDRGGLQLQPLQNRRDFGVDRAVTQKTHAVRKLAPQGDAGVGQHRMQQDQALLLAIFRDIADAMLVQGLGHRGDVNGLACNLNFARQLFGKAKNCLGQFAAPRTDKAIKANDFTRSHRQANIAVARARGVSGQLQIGRHVRLRTRRAFGDPFRAADHHLHHICAAKRGQIRRIAGIDTVAQHRHAVADVEHLFQLVADKADRHPIITQPAQNTEQHRGFVWGQGCRRLVQQQDA